jgi:hypothetical protein
MLASVSSRKPASQLAGSDEQHERAAIEAEVDKPDELQSKYDRAESDLENGGDQRDDDCPPARALANTPDGALGGLDVSALVI